MAQVVKTQYVSKGGEWVEVATTAAAGGADEVAIQNDQPSTPTDLWLDLDEPATPGGDSTPPGVIQQYAGATAPAGGPPRGRKDPGRSVGPANGRRSKYQSPEHDRVMGIEPT